MNIFGQKKKKEEPKKQEVKQVNLQETVNRVSIINNYI
jgi:hypothetical protein